ncbi:MAG: biopolymer transporter ExbD [Nitrospiria bacterium]
MSAKRRRRTIKNAVVQLTVISLMDIFTILLLFLLLQLGDEGVALPASDRMRLPDSTSKNKPKSTVQLMVTEADILVDGGQVMGVDEALGQQAPVLSPVKAALTRLSERTKFVAGKNTSVRFTGEITLLGDRKIPFKLLKKIMRTCVEAGYPNISLGVTQREVPA